jgi:hypothetical protein
MTPFLVVLVFALIFVALSLFKPSAGRIFIGVFFLLMSLGVNTPLMLTHPELYPAAGSHALLPLYRWFFNSVLPLAPLPWIIALICVEIAIAGAILSKGSLVHFGLLAGALFCLAIAPLGMEELSSPVICLGMLALLRCDYPLSILDLLHIKKPLEA